MGGFPTTVLARIIVARAPGITTIPCVFPVTTFSSMTLPVAVPMIPIPKSSAGSEKPLPCALFSRTRLL
jgi:hypothetical protein